MALFGEGGVETGHNYHPSKCVEKALFSWQILEHFSALDMTKTFEYTFRQFARSTPHVLDFRLACRSRASKHKN